MDYVFTNRFKVYKDFDLDFFKKAIKAYTSEETEAEVFYDEEDSTLSFRIEDYLITMYDLKYTDLEKTELTKKEFLSLPEEVEMYIQSILEDGAYCILRETDLNYQPNVSFVSVVITKEDLDVIDLSLEEEDMAKKLLQAERVINPNDVIVDSDKIKSFLRLSNKFENPIKRKYNSSFIEKAGTPTKTVIEGENSIEYKTVLSLSRRDEFKDVDLIDVMVYKEGDEIVKIIEI